MSAPVHLPHLAVLRLTRVAARHRRHSLRAVATLAAQFFFDWVFARVKWFTNYAPSGSVSVPDVGLFGLVLNTPTY